MGQFRGVVTNVGQTYDRLRLYRLDVPGRFVEFPTGAGRLSEEPRGESMLPVHLLDIADDDFEDGYEQDDVDLVFSEQPETDDEFALFITRTDVRNPDRSQDGSAFRCCYTPVYC